MKQNPPIDIQDLGLVPYDQALTLQRELNQAVIDGQAPPTILLVEHPPVITLTRRAAPNLLANEEQLAKLGVATAETDRGGDITYHGPGQLVVYPILKLADFGLNLSSYMRLLERTVIDTIANWGIAGHNECGATGVWVDSIAPGGSQEQPLNTSDEAKPADTSLLLASARSYEEKNANPNTAKICAMGVRIRKNTTLHGLALNVAPDLSHFNLIVPCGLADRSVTSMQQLLGDECPSMQQVKDVFKQTLTDCLQNTGESSSCATGSGPGTNAGS